MKIRPMAYLAILALLAFAIAGCGGGGGGASAAPPPPPPRHRLRRHFR